MARKSYVGKTVIAAGRGAFPGEGSECKIRVWDYPKDCSTFRSLGIKKVGVYSITIGEADGEFDCGFEYALTIMNQFESSLIELGFEEHSFKIAVELLEFSEPVPFFKLDSVQKLEIAKKHKSIGVNLFKSSLIKEAFYRFSKSIRYIVSLRTGDTTSQEVNSIYSSVCNNMALCQLQTGNYEMAITLCEKVLQVCPVNVKALFRRAEAQIKLKVFDRAADDLKTVISLEPSNKVALKSFEYVRKELDKQEKTYVNMVKRMFPVK